jgi:hypothetical protein
MRCPHFKAFAAITLAFAGIAGQQGVFASDHGDTPHLVEAGRNDARLTDLFAFTRGENLVLIVCLDPTIPPSAIEANFAPDVLVKIYIDNDSAVSFDEAEDVATLGGTLPEPGRVQEDVSFQLRFDAEGEPMLSARGLGAAAQRDIELWSGLRDDPFIRGPRIGRNVAAIVIELPLEHVLDEQDAILVWATSGVMSLRGAIQEHAGRALRSQFPENHGMNTLQPRLHWRRHGFVPDVVIYDTSRPAAFPNGRELADDVVDLVGDPRVLSNDAPFPSENDLPFLAAFPYLPPPHPPAP